jgi:glycine betaine/choline ABC-type transport system substrate-binding protein
MALVALLAAAVLSGCGSGDSTSTEAPSRPNKNAIIIFRPKYKDQRVTIGAARGPEQQIFGEMFAQALDTAGFDVRRNFSLASQEAALQALKAGKITAFQEYPREILARFYGMPESKIPAGPGDAFTLAQKKLVAEGLNIVGPLSDPPYSFGTAVVVDAKSAERKGVQNISDLGGRGPITLYGPAACQRQVACLPALEATYGLKVASYHAADEAEAAAAVEAGRADAAIATTISPELADENGSLVSLKDDQRAFPRTKSTMVTTLDATQKWFPDFSKWPYEAQRGLTFKWIRTLKAEVELEGKSPKEAISTYLHAANYIE